MKPFFSFQWHITDQCDQRCRHCYIFSIGEEVVLKRMDLGQMTHVLDSCLEMCDSLGRSPYFYITGGDPILNPDFWGLLEMLHEKSVPFAIMGNPFHLTPEVCSRMRDLGCQKYQVSIDGLKEMHDRIRMPGSYDATMRAIRIIRDSGIRCAVMTTVSRANADQMPGIIDAVVESGADIFAFARYCPEGGDFGGDPLTPAEYRDVLEACWSKFGEHEGCGTTFNLKDHLWTPFLYEKGLFRIGDFPDDALVYDGCNCGANHLTILPDGDVYACRRMDSKVGNVFEQSMRDIFLGDEEESYREIRLLDKCSKCRLLRFCRGCPAVAEATNGDRRSADPQCWVDVESEMYRAEA